MKYFIVMVFMAHLVVSCQAQAPSVKNDTVNGPRITFDSTTINLGKIPMHSPSVFRLKYTNTGNEDLFITHIGTSDPCYGSCDKELIFPGESGYIEIKCPTQRLWVIGNKQLVVYSNAINNEVRITIKGEVVPSAMIDFDTRVIDIGDVELNPASEAKFVFKFTNIGNADLVIAGAYHSGGPGTAEPPRDIIQPGGHGEILATYGLITPGRFTKTVRVVSNAANAGHGNTILTIKGNIVEKK